MCETRAVLTVCNHCGNENNTFAFSGESIDARYLNEIKFDVIVIDGVYKAFVSDCSIGRFALLNQSYWMEKVNTYIQAASYVQCQKCGGRIFKSIER